MTVLSARLRPKRLEQSTLGPAPAPIEPTSEVPGSGAAAAATDGFDRIRTSPFSRPRAVPEVRHPRIPRDASAKADSGEQPKGPVPQPEAAVTRADGSGGERPVYRFPSQKAEALEALQRDPRAYFDIREPLASDEQIRNAARKMTKEQALEAVRQQPALFFAVRNTCSMLSSDPDIRAAAAALTKEEAVKGLREHPWMYHEVREVSQSLGSDPEVIFEAARGAPSPEYVLKNLPEALKQDHGLFLRLIGENLRVIKAIPEELLKDPKFLTEAATVYPPILDEAKGPISRDALLAADPALNKRYTSVKKVLQELQIEDPIRLQYPSLLEELMRNRVEPRAADDGRPTALVIFAKKESDSNGALNNHNLDELAKHYRIMYYEARTEQDFIDAVKDSARAGAAALVDVSAHGRQSLMNLGEAKYSGQHEEYQVDLGDEAQLRAAELEKYVQPDATILLESCSQGAGEGKENNQANMFARVFPGREVIAPTTLIQPSRYEFDEQGLVSGPTWTGPATRTYRVRVDPQATPGGPQA